MWSVLGLSLIHISVVTPSGMYFFYCVNAYEAERVGTVIMCDKMTDPLTLEGNPVCVIRPTLDEEIYQRDRSVSYTHLDVYKRQVLSCLK